jgi:dinuclear metal center YbgI/SA1388 family protein
LDNNLAVYGCHLPLDCHPEIGNNAILAQKLGLIPYGSFLPFEGTDIGLLAESSLKRTDLRNQLQDLFPMGITAIEFGSESPQKIALLTGSGQSAVDKILDAGTDTLITGELKQHHFNMAQELKLNLYACGHYATETFGVDALAQEVAEKFDLPYEFIPTECTL